MFIKVKVFPKSRKKKIEKIDENKFEIFTKSPAKNKAANEEALEMVAGFFKIPKKNVRIISGHQRPNKMFELINFKEK